MKIYKSEDTEAVSLFHIMVNTMNLYNEKINTLNSTRLLIQSMATKQQFEDFDALYINRCKVQMSLVDESTVSTYILIFLKFMLFKKIYSQTLSNTFKLY